MADMRKHEFQLGMQNSSATAYANTVSDHRGQTLSAPRGPMQPAI